MRVPERFIDKIMEEGEIQRMAVMANFGNLSEYEKLQLSWAHGIASVTGLRLGVYMAIYASLGKI